MVMSHAQHSSRDASRAPTGPKSVSGRHFVSRNATTYGIFTTRAVVPGIESEEEWDSHRQGTFTSLAPHGHLEETYAHRIALLLWRLGRIVRYETEEIALRQEAIDQDVAATVPAVTATATGQRATLPSRPNEHTHIIARLATGPDALRHQLADARRVVDLLPRLFNAPQADPVDEADVRLILQYLAYEAGPDAPQPDIPNPPHGWNAQSLRTAMAQIAINQSVGDVIGRAVASTRRLIIAAERHLEVVEDAAQRLSRRRILPQRKILDRVSKYEAHLNRQLVSALHELEAIQFRRTTGSAPPLIRHDHSGLPDASDAP